MLRLPLSLAAVWACAHAVVIRDDVDDSQYIVKGKAPPPGGKPAVGADPHPEVVWIINERTHSGYNVNCAGTMISDRHVVTARHCCSPLDGKMTGYTITVAGQARKAASVSLDMACPGDPYLNGCDHAVITLDAPVTSGFAPVPVYPNSDEAGKHMTILGWGVTGKASKLTRKFCLDGDLDGYFRKAENVIESAVAGILRYKMDRPGKGALPLEGIDASGDSGGPMYIEGTDGVTYIAGVNSGSNARDGGCDYGDTDQFARLSWRHAWFQGIISNTTQPTQPPQPPAPQPQPPRPPAPAPAPAQAYRCTNGACVASADGLTKSECEQGCVPATTYKCADGKCAAMSDGLTKAACTQICA